MKRLFALALCVFLVSLLLVGCGAKESGLGSVPTPGATTIEGAQLSTTQSEHDSDESDGFQAVVTSATSVMLTWSPVEGADGYLLEGSIGGLDFFPLASLHAEATSYEAFPVPDEALLNFRVTAVSGDSNGSNRTVSVETPTEIPNPYSVEVALEQTQGVLAGFDPATFDPATFDPAALDPSLFDPDNLDLSSLAPRPATVTQEIGPEGGRLEVTAENGTVYSLTIPEGALAYSLDISMTPIAFLSGMPAGSEVLAAVQIEPEGMLLDAPALLTISWPEAVEIPDDQMLVGIGFGTGGSDFHFQPFSIESLQTAAPSGGRLSSTVLRPSAIGPGGLSMSQLQSQGAAKASPSTVTNTQRSNPPADRTRSTRQRAAVHDASSSPNNAGGDDLFPLVPPFENWLGQNIEKRATDSGSTSGTYRDLMDAMSDYEFLLEKWGDNLSDTEKDRIWDALVEAIYKRLKEAAEASCMSDAHMYGIQLAERLTNPASPFNRELLRRFTEKYGSEGSNLIKKARELAHRCPLYLRVTSNVIYEDLDGGLVATTKISVDVPLQWRFGGSARKPFLRGVGDITYEKAEYHFVDAECLAKPDTTGGSKFIVLRLSPVFDGKGLLNDFHLERYKVTGRMDDIIFTVRLSEDASCKLGKVGGKVGGGDLWWTNYGAYMLVKGFDITDWVIRANAGMSTIADKQVDHNDTTIDLGHLVGTTKFILINENPQ